MEKARQLAEEFNNESGQILIHWDLLQNACLNKKNLIVKLLDLFVQQTPGWIESLQESVRTLDTQAIRKDCHTVKGAVAAIHAEACFDSLERLNKIAREDEGDHPGLQEAFDDAVLIFGKTKKAISEILKVFSEC